MRSEFREAELLPQPQSGIVVSRRIRHSGLNIAGFVQAALFATGVLLGHPGRADAQVKTTKCEASIRIGSLPGGNPAEVIIRDATTMELYGSGKKGVGEQFSIVAYTIDGIQSSWLFASASSRPTDNLSFRMRCTNPENKTGGVTVYTVFFDRDLSVSSSLEFDTPAPLASPVPTAEPTLVPSTDETINKKNLNPPPDIPNWVIRAGIVVAGLFGLRKINPWVIDARLSGIYRRVF